MERRTQLRDAEKELIGFDDVCYLRINKGRAEKIVVSQRNE